MDHLISDRLVTMKRAAVAKPASALRSRLTNTTRQVIVDALVAQLAERDVLDISYAELARRAGVSIQTLYRHYPTRADLHDALTRRVGAALAISDYPQTREGVVALVRALFPRFDANAQLLVAQIHAGAGGESRAKGRKRRGNAFQVVLASAVPTVPAERRRAAAGVMNLLVSVNTWYRLRDELGLDGAAIGDIAAWAVDALWRALEIDDERARRGRGG
jgi:AcrR family transcriptional regulator